MVNYRPARLDMWWLDEDFTSTASTYSVFTATSSTDCNYITTYTYPANGFYTDEYDDEKIIENKYKTKNHALPPQKRGDLLF
jgi:hypothetical protein